MWETVSPTLQPNGRAVRRRGVALPLLPVALAFCAAVTLLAQAPADAIRARLSAAQREAVALMNTASRVDASSEEAGRALLEAARRFETLAADDATLLAPALRSDLRRAAADLRASTGAERRIDVRPFLALLERVRIQLEGEVALGLTFEGSYSQSKAKDPAYGGHASGMGPAPGPMEPSEADAAPSPVSFEEGAHLPTRTHGGGPTKDHILESSGSGVAMFD